MYNEGTILIASTSKAIVTHIQNRLEEIEAPNKTICAQNSDELHFNLDSHHLTFLFIEASFYQEATPEQIVRIIKKFISLRVYIFSYHEYADSFLKFYFRAGVEGYLDMRRGKGLFKDDLKRVLTGEMVIPPQFEGMSFDYLPGYTRDLTCRDMDIVHLIMGGLENKDIAQVLDLKLQSVKNRRRAIYDKLQVTNTVGLLKKIIRKGLIDLNEFLAC